MAVQHKTNHYAPHLETLHDFFNSFSRKEASDLLYKMMRAAFASEDILTKKDVKDFVFLRDELQGLIAAAEVLASDNAHKTRLEKFFRRWPAEEWIATLDLLFYAAIYDGFFTCVPDHGDIYHYCRGLHALVQACAVINEAYGPD